MYSSHMLTTLSLLSLPFSILAAPAPVLYKITAGSIKPRQGIPQTREEVIAGDSYVITKDFGLTVWGVNPGNIPIECKGPAFYDLNKPLERFPAKLDCPADPSGAVFVTVGNDLKVHLDVQWYGDVNTKRELDFDYGLSDGGCWTTDPNGGAGGASWTLSKEMEL
ncbi:MAG: hypothetical protein Q9221_007327 [Calogaya cf. arnoldii]